MNEESDLDISVGLSKTGRVCIAFGENNVVWLDIDDAVYLSCELDEVVGALLEDFEPANDVKRTGN